MPSCITEQWVATAPQVKLTVTQSASTATTATLSWVLEYIASSAANTNTKKAYTVVIHTSTVKDSTFDIDGLVGTHTIASGTVVIDKKTSAQAISFGVIINWDLTWSGVRCGTKTASGDITVPAKTSYKINYDANGGTGAPSAQTKWHGESVLLSSVKPSRTGYSFKNWLSTVQNQAYNPGAYYGHDEATTMKAQWVANTYAVTYDANGGTGAPAAQSKTHGVALALSSAVPTRSGFTFKGWATSASATVAAYQPGASYTANAAVKLYAVWGQAYVQPRISNIQVSRCDASGRKTDSGTYSALSFNWQADYSANVTVTAQSNGQTITLYTKADAGTAGAVSGVFGGAQLSADVTYKIQITVTDSGGETSVTTTLQSRAFAIDFLAGGNGVAFGKAAERSGYADFGFDIADKYGLDVRNGLAAYTGGGDAGIDPNTTLEELCLTGHSNGPQGPGTFYYIKTNFYNAKTTGAARAQIAIPYNKNGSLYHRYYSGSTWSSWARYMTADEIYPVGSVCIRYDNTSPADLYGGTWSRIEGRVLFGCATSGTIGATGSHTTGSGSSSLPYVNVAVWRRTA